MSIFLLAGAAASVLQVSILSCLPHQKGSLLAGFEKSSPFDKSPVSLFFPTLVDALEPSSVGQVQDLGSHCFRGVAVVPPK